MGTDFSSWKPVPRSHGANIRVGTAPLGPCNAYSVTVVSGTLTFVGNGLDHYDPPVIDRERRPASCDSRSLPQPRSVQPASPRRAGLHAGRRTLCAPGDLSRGPLLTYNNVEELWLDLLESQLI